VNATLAAPELDQFQVTIAERLGLRFDDGRLTFLAELLARRVQERHTDVTSYLTALSAEPNLSGELGELARELTVGETYFFRHGDQFQALREVALPERLSARAASRKLKLLSAGCASGEEAYSLSILLRERGVEPGFEVSVQGVDLNPDALAKARRAVYSPWSLRETSDELRERWFERDGRDFRLAKSIRESVRFDQHNLILPAPSLLPPGSFDIVFCRNVLMYFTPEHAAQAVSQLAAALAPGGFLFLGHAETLRGLSHDFHLRHTHNTFYYQLKSGDETALGSQNGATSSSRPPFAPAARASTSSEWVGTWLETVQRSSERIRELSSQGGTPAPTTPHAPELVPPPSDLSRPLQLLRHERFAEALELLHPPTPSSGVDPAALLLRAALLSHQGALDEARQVCHELLRLDDLNAGAHYLLALCCERRGETEQAVEHDRTAVYLDAGFAMPHLHLGLMARRRRETASAKHELERALLLLEREDESRLLLFGGGFTRSALLALCRSELANLKVKP
jgi:chemotaxis protein methyltransferase CheR